VAVFHKVGERKGDGGGEQAGKSHRDLTAGAKGLPRLRRGPGEAVIVNH